MKTLIIRLRSKRGMTLIEVVSACLLLTFVMAAILSFTMFSTNYSGITMYKASTQNELRLMMLNIKNEVTAAIGGEIIDNAALSSLGNLSTADTEVLMGFENGRFRITLHPPGGPPETVHEYIEIPYLTVNFYIDPNQVNMLIVTLTVDNPDRMRYFRLQDSILLPNIDTKYGNPIVVSSTTGGNSLHITTPNPL